MEEPKIVNYHHLAKIGIKEIFYFYSADAKKWKWNEKMIETIDGQEWLYISENNNYQLREPKLQEI